jgi:hypothetical protein
MDVIDLRWRKTFLVEVKEKLECGICGYVMLFSAERFRTGDDETLVRGMTEQEEAELERRHPL